MDIKKMVADIKLLVVECEGKTIMLEKGSVFKMKTMFEPEIGCQTIVVITTIKATDNKIVIETLNTENRTSGEIIRDFDEFELEELILSTQKIK